MKEEKKYLGKWHAGNIALFGAILMSHGITGKDKEFLKKLMYEALTEKTKPQKTSAFDKFLKRRRELREVWEKLRIDYKLF